VVAWPRDRLLVAFKGLSRFQGVRSFGLWYGLSAFRTAAQRRQLAYEAALAVAADLGVTADGAVIVEDWNNTIVRLGATTMVAKVGTSHFRDARLESLERELAVSTYLAAFPALRASSTDSSS